MEGVGYCVGLIRGIGIGYNGLRGIFQVLYGILD